MKTESANFVELLAARRPATHIGRFDETEWFEGAYRTLDRRTILTKHLAKGEKNQCRKRIFGSLRRIALVPAPDFDAEIEHVIRDLSQDFTLSIGQAQKLINILLKYHACLFHSGSNPTWNRQNPWVRTILNVQHVPIDSVLLFNLCRLAPQQCFGLVSARATYPFEARPKLGYTCMIVGNGRRYPWSGMDDYETYYRLQVLIRALSAAQKIPAILYEMRYLWLP